jgi:serine protease Do/serine protease DegQ
MRPIAMSASMLLLLAASPVLAACTRADAPGQAARGQRDAPVIERMPVQPGGEGTGGATIAPMLERVVPSVVAVRVSGRVQQRNPLFEDPFFRRFFGPQGPPQERPFRSAGSGVVVDADNGYIVTNSHVVENADDIEIVFGDGRTVQANMVGMDPDVDVAVLEVDADDIEPLPFGNSDDLRVGDFVAAVGNPFGLTQTATFGIVSALGRTGLRIEEYEDFIQTDASINPGNSGGALVNMRGELIGINTAIVGPSGGNVGIGFAIPINMVERVMSQLVEFGEVRRGRLGVLVQDLTPALAESFGLDIQQGALISDVEEGTPAAEAGLEPGDVVVRVNDTEIEGSAELRNEIGLRPAGETVRLQVVRDEERRTIDVEIGSVEGGAGATGQRIAPLLEGVRFGETEDEEGPSGLRVTAVSRESVAWRSGLRPGDVVTSVNQQRVRTIADLREIAETDPRRYLLRVIREDRGLFITIP